MPEVQKVIAETLRMWPAPPLLIRCATEAVTWPEGGTQMGEIRISHGCSKSCRILKPVGKLMYWKELLAKACGA